MVYPTSLPLLPLMHTHLLPIVDWTHAPADLNGLVRFAERRNPFSARVPSHFKRSLRRSSTAFNFTLLIPLSHFQTLWRQTYELSFCIYTRCAEEVFQTYKSASFRVGIKFKSFTGFKADGSSKTLTSITSSSVTTLHNPVRFVLSLLFTGAHSSLFKVKNSLGVTILLLNLFTFILFLNLFLWLS
jgi:hypothetical protein